MTWSMYATVTVLLAFIESVLSTNHCPVGYVPWQNTCYKIARTSQDWDSAKTACEGDGGNLLAITSRAKHSQVRDFLSSQSVALDDLWLCANDRLAEGMFTWHSATGGDYFTWCDSPQQPNGSNSENCLKLTISCQFKFQDDACSQKLGFICEKTPQPMAIDVDKILFSSSKYAVEKND